jgi:hypothetical protein
MSRLYPGEVFLPSFRALLARVPFLCLPKEKEPKERAPEAAAPSGFPALLGPIGARLTRSSEENRSDFKSDLFSSEQLKQEARLSRLPLRCSAAATGIWAEGLSAAVFGFDFLF